MSAVLFYGVLIAALFACIGILIVLTHAGSDEEEQLRTIEENQKNDSPAARVHTEPGKGDANANTQTPIRPRSEKDAQPNAPRRKDDSDR